MNKNWIYYLTHKRTRKTRTNSNLLQPNRTYIDDVLHNPLDNEETNNNFIGLREEEFVYKTPDKKNGKKIQTPKSPHNKRRLVLENDIPILRINLIPVFQRN